MPIEVVGRLYRKQTLNGLYGLDCLRYGDFAPAIKRPVASDAVQHVDSTCGKDYAEEANPQQIPFGQQFTASMPRFHEAFWSKRMGDSRCREEYQHRVANQFLPHGVTGHLCNGDITSTSGATALGPTSPRHYMSLRAHKDRQPRHSDNQRAYVPPERSRRKNDWTEENQNMHNACGNCPASSGGLLLPDGSPCCSTDNGDDEKECHVEHVAQGQKSIVSMIESQNTANKEEKVQQG